ncbi:hypothetical protein EYC80_003851 [Monilinia laxa]|uniref:Uncharacterized protein n=1 Tax=Monilinia laxa TaxID=61186 RepID=A0A5N6KLC1_MONLA|nr:hypothetical protein EYC80_003851 [Monilinia laxa]
MKPNTNPHSSPPYFSSSVPFPFNPSPHQNKKPYVLYTQYTLHSKAFKGNYPSPKKHTRVTYQPLGTLDHPGYTLISLNPKLSISSQVQVHITSPLTSSLNRAKTSSANHPFKKLLIH